MAIPALVKSHGHRGIGALLAVKGALALGGVGPGMPVGPVTFDNIEQRLEEAAQGNSAGQTQSQGTTDLLVGGALASLRREQKAP